MMHNVSLFILMRLINSVYASLVKMHKLLSLKIMEWRLGPIL